jgi:S-DNA-T family DNA segregation ATPase FtsK/SpoIIIE
MPMNSQPQQKKMNLSLTFNGFLMVSGMYLCNQILPVPSNIMHIGVYGGIVLSAAGLLMREDQVEKIFKLCLGNEGIQLIKKEQKPYGYDAIFYLPTGLNINDFEEAKLSIEQALNGEVTFSYADKKIMAKIALQKLERSYPYETIKTAKETELVIGYSRDGVEIFDLAKAVHLLIAGETGAGKSVCIRGILTNLIQTKSAIILNLVDFKRVELGIFKRAGKVKSFCTNAYEFENLLDSLEEESESRYEKFENAGLVNIESWNKQYYKLPYIITIVDEFATLQKEKTIMTKLCRRLEKDRACGIHYILCTQRPSAKILSGDIKANIPATIAFKCRNKVNSNIILDEAGAELLPGEGAGLLSWKGLKRIQTMFLSETDAANLIKPYERREDNANKKGYVDDGPNCKITLP